jgi:hypothetical protein
MSDIQKITGDPANPRPPRKRSKPRSPSRVGSARAASNCARRCRSQNSFQSTARPPDAYAVFTSALEGFAPTAEMPEIAEALELMAAIKASTQL